jgi:hypothetical protein
MGDRVSEHKWLKKDQPDPAPDRPSSRGPLIWNDLAELPADRDDPLPVDLPWDRWSYEEQTVATPMPRPVRRGGAAGPPSWVLGVVAVAVIGGFAWMVLWPLIVRPTLRAAALDGLRQGLSSEFSRFDTLPLLETGQLVITETQINNYLHDHAASFAPVAEPRILFSPRDVRFVFSFARSENILIASPTVEQGRLLLKDPTIVGPAARILQPSDVTRVIEAELARLFEHTSIRPTSVDPRDAMLIISTSAIR